MKRLCTICARGGSKGVPGKNIRPLLGKPLIAWSVERALASGLFEHVAVSSDDDAILDAAAWAGATKLVKRPDELATDQSAKVPAILHALTTVERETGTRFDILVDLDATSPLRTVADIAGTVELLEAGQADNVITGASAHRSPYFNLVERQTDGTVRLSKADSGVVRRQDAPPAFDMNASIYAWRRDKFVSDPRVFYPSTLLFEMPDERSRDIDAPLDFRIVELLMREQIQSEPDPFDLTGKVVAITGAAGILGRHFCETLASRGAVIAVLDLKGTAEVAADIRRRYGRAIGVDLDVTDPAACRGAVEQIERELGPIDVLHNNAASKGRDLARFFDSVESYSPEVWREIVEVNLDGYFFMAQAAGSRMAERGHGAIIQTCSIYGVVGPDQRIYEGSEYMGMPINTPAVYSASKAGVDGLTRYLATYWGPRGVRVNSLTPGGVGSGQNAEFDRRYSARVPLGRMGTPQDMANALVYLASDASRYVTGHNLIVDGGLVAW